MDRPDRTGGVARAPRRREGQVINLQSDLMVAPTEEMWRAMRSVRPGWVIDREDANVRLLEDRAAHLMGKEAGLYVPTVRMGLLVAFMTYCERGHQVITGEYSHVICCEEWGLCYICGVFPRLVDDREGRLDPSEVEAAITESRFSHLPSTDLVCIENTHNGAGGRVTTRGLTEEICELAHGHGARVLIDGARVLYAAAALGVAAEELVAPADAVCFSLIKGLGAPQGAVLCGPRQDIDRAFVNLRRLGGHAVHRAGIFAAAGVVALEIMREHLDGDIARAKKFAGGLQGIPGIEVDVGAVETNIVMADVSATGLDTTVFLSLLMDRGVRGHRYTDRIARFTFHRDITDADADAAVEAIRAVAWNAGGTEGKAS